MTEATEANAGFDEWLDAMAAGEGYYLECSNGHGTLPPARVCPDCGETTLESSVLTDVGTIETYTVVHVATPDFEEDTPYVTAVADFDPVSLTGVVRGVDPAAVEVGTVVEPGVEETETGGDALLVFRPPD